MELAAYNERGAQMGRTVASDLNKAADWIVENSAPAFVSGFAAYGRGMVTVHRGEAGAIEWAVLDEDVTGPHFVTLPDRNALLRWLTRSSLVEYGVRS